MLKLYALVFSGCFYCLFQIFYRQHASVGLAALFSSSLSFTNNQSKEHLRGGHRTRTRVPSSPHIDTADYYYSSSYTATPVIGVLSQPHNDTHNYIAASYIKWLEAGGARSIVIPFDLVDNDDNDGDDLVEEIWSQINGILLPGGEAPFPLVLRRLLDRVVDQSNNNNNNNNHNPQKYSKEHSASDVIPVWGTCLGYEFLLQYFGGEAAMEDGFNSENVSWPLILTDDDYDDDGHEPYTSTLYSDESIRRIVTRQNVTLNNHLHGIRTDSFYRNKNLTKHFVVTSTNYDLDGQHFVSTIEPRNPGQLPVYGVQYHPEKNAFEYATYPEYPNVPYEAINHSPDAIKFAMYTSQFFVNLVRKFAGLSSNKQPPIRHTYTLTDKYPYVYTYPQETGVKFEQIYLMPRRDKKESPTSYSINEKTIIN